LFAMSTERMLDWNLQLRPEVIRWDVGWDLWDL